MKVVILNSDPSNLRMSVWMKVAILRFDPGGLECKMPRWMKVAILTFGCHMYIMNTSTVTSTNSSVYILSVVVYIGGMLLRTSM